jgi:hypothetical protein
MMFVGYVIGHELTAVLMLSGAGLLVTAIWCAVSKQAQYTWLFGTVAGFNLTYAFLQIGDWHNWWGIPNSGLPRMISIVIGIWIVLFAIVAYVMSRDAKGLSAVLVLADAGLVVALVALNKNSISLFRWAAIPMFSIALLCLYDVFKIRSSQRKRPDQSPHSFTVVGGRTLIQARLLVSKRAQDRDEVAGERDEIADERDEAAEERDQLAEQRDEAAEERDRMTEQSQGRLGQADTTDTLSRSALARREAAADRTQASQDRHAAASERTQAELDRNTALADREESALDRKDASDDDLSATYERRS